jgi:hypothetical protein
VIIFGFRSRPATIAVLNLACRNGHIASHRLMKVTRWFTLFFIPVIPFSRSYYTVCAQCGTNVKWSKADADLAVAQAVPATDSPAPVDPVARPIPMGPPDASTAATSAPPAGWYQDPNGTGSTRYWDGAAWTDAVSPN